MRKKKIFLSVVIVLLLIGIVVWLLPEKKEKGETSISTQTYTINANDIFQLEAKPVLKMIDGIRYEMYGYNGQIPGPLFKVKQHSKVFINFTNNIDMPTTIHWHGLRHQNKDDGVPEVTQNQIQPGEHFLYELQFPDPGMYWYHPHLREDIQQEKGLYGAILVEPADQSLASVEYEIPLILDDMLTTNGGFVPFGEKYANFALMGRFGNMLIVNGQTNYQMTVGVGDTIHFSLLNAASVRPFKISIEKTPLNVMGSDLSLYEKAFIADSILIAPGERYIVEATFEQPGIFKLLHTTPEKTYTLGEIVAEDKIARKAKKENIKNDHTKVQEDIKKFRPFFEKEPDYTFALDVDMRGMQMEPMHNHEPIEWEDAMFAMNQMHTSGMMSWIIEDVRSGKKNMDIMHEVNVGDVKKIRIINKEDSMHPMQHPIHLHGQRFLVLEENGKKNDNLVWKDTVLVTRGSTVDILVDFSNPGEWMLHCHIPEHLESGMMMLFNVKKKEA